MNAPSLPGEPDRGAALAVDEMHDLLVDLPAEHHFDEVHRFGVGHAHALDELAFLADALQELVDLRSAAVHDDRVHADQLQQHHVAREAFLELVLGHRIAAVFHDDRLAVEALYVRQRLGEDAGLDGTFYGRRRAHAGRSCLKVSAHFTRRRP